MRRRAFSSLVALLVVAALSVMVDGPANAVVLDLTGTWVNKTEWGATLTVGQRACGILEEYCKYSSGVVWSARSNNGLWTQTFSGSELTSYYFGGGFNQTEPSGTPQKYTGSIAFRLTDSCHFNIVTADATDGRVAKVNHLKGLVFTKTPCDGSIPPPPKSATPTKIVWPALSDALVPLETVSNGCGGGDAGTDPMYGDDSEYVNSEIPNADTSSWDKALKYYVNFREACKQHDAAYSHAKVNGEMTLRGRPKPKPKIVDYFTWTKAAIDTKFLEDMIKICDVSIPKTAKIALNNCKNNGGFHTVSGAKTRYDIVAATTYSQKIWKGLGFYQEAPALTGTWTVPGVTTGPWSFTQSHRRVNVKWTGGSAQPEFTGEFRGMIISHDKDSTIEGFYVTTNNGVSTWNPKTRTYQLTGTSSSRKMSFSWNPKTPDQLRSSTGVNLVRG